jgi:uncharacterized membrane protein YfcA
MIQLPSVVVAVVAGIVYGALWYARNRYRPDEGEGFRPLKFAATLAVSALVGLGAGLAGDPLGYTAIEQQLLAYAGAISLLEALLKTAFDRL